jgi:hypothetical protein
MRLWRQRQEAVRDFCGGDNVVDPPRLMRVAGTVNHPVAHKRERGYATELIELHCSKVPPVSDEDFDFGGFAGTRKTEPPHSNDDARPDLGDDKIAAWFAKIDANAGEWHNSVRDLVARLVREGYDRRIILGLAPRLTAGKHTVAETEAELREFIRGAEQKYGGDAADEDEDDDWGRSPEPERLAIWDGGEDTAPIPPREWLLGRFLCREFLSSVLGDGAVGKTAFRIACALSLAANRNLIGEPVYQRCCVLLVCLEDGRDELRRRVRAAMIHHGVSNDEIRGWLFLCGLNRNDLKLAQFNRGNLQKGRLGAVLETEIVERQVDVLILDPLVKTHSLPENSNETMDFIAQILTELAIKYRIAVDAPHHIRKGANEPGDADAGRGGSAFKNAGRLVFSLTKMTEETARLFQLSERERRQLVRVDSAKVNLAPPIEARWYRIVGIELGNGTERYPYGDEVAAIECWLPPDLFEGLGVAIINAILDEIDQGLPDGSRYSDHNAAKKRAAWQVVARHALQKNEAQCREIIRVWVRNGVLVLDEYRDEERHETVKGLRVDPTKRPG